MGVDQALDASPATRRFGVRRFILLQLLIWTTYGVVHYAASIPAILPEERQIIGIAKAIRAVTGLGISSLLVPLLEWRRLSQRNALIVVALTASIAAGFAWMFVDRVVLVTVASIAQLSIPWERFPHGMDLDYVFVMFAWTAAYLGLMHFERGQAQREELLKQRVHMQGARLSLLAAQLNPHFLFNSLNTIRSLAAEDATRTREVVSRLSSFLRRVISFDAAVPVPLEQEIELARDYLSVEQARFESGLDVTLDIDQAPLNVMVPPLILQPLLENAIKHGEPNSSGVRRVSVGVSADDREVSLHVTNTGSLSGSHTVGLGLELTRSRLAHMYGEGQTFRLSQRDGHVVATITIDKSRLNHTTGAAS